MDIDGIKPQYVQVSGKVQTENSPHLVIGNGLQ